MADCKKYYYLKLKEDFFESETMTLLESMRDGYLYSNILLKLYLKSLKDNGRLTLNHCIPYNAQMLATVTRHQVGTVKEALKIFKELGLVEVLDNGAIYMIDVQNFVGRSSTEADRKREYRARIENERYEIGQMSERIPGQMSGQMTGQTPPEIEKEIEKENRDNIYIVEQSTTYPIKEVIDYLNQKTGKHYKYSSEVTQKHIRARFRDGFTLEDFKRVINWKKSQWTGTDLEIYLRPQTLFGTKFESYLNEIPRSQQEPERPREEPGQSIDFSEVEREW